MADYTAWGIRELISELQRRDARDAYPIGGTREVVHVMDTATTEGEERANRLRSRLYTFYNSVQVYPDGLCRVRIVATDPIPSY